MKLSVNTALKALAALVLALVFQAPAIAQFDTEFWMPPIWDSGESGHNQPSELFITTPSPNPVNVHVESSDGTSFVFDGQVWAGNPLVVPLTPALGQTTVPNAVNTTAGLVVSAEQAIQCVHKISAGFNQTLVTLKGRNGLGTDFWAGSQVRNMNATYSPNEFHFISVMAIENNTTITFETPFDMFFPEPANLPNPYTIVLNAGESYLIRGNNPIQHVAGAHVTSDKNILVNSGSTHTRIAGGNAADGGTDQLVPIDLMGTEFVVLKGQNTDPFDYAIIVATENNTQVFVNGSDTPITTLNAGQVYDYTLTGTTGSPHYLRTSNVAYCYHFTGASNDDEVGMSAIPQIDCTGSRYIEFSRFQVNTSNQMMNITASPEAAATLEWNGVPYNSVPNAIINSIPGLPGWVAITMPNSALQSNNIITSEGFFHAGFLTGNGGSTGTYGYLSGFNDAYEFLDPVTFLPTTIYTVGTLCTGQSIDHCLLVYSCADDHNIIDVESNNGNAVITPPTSPFDTCFTYTAPFNFAGRDTLTLTVENRYGFIGNIDVVFRVVNPETPIDAGPTQELCGVTTGTLSAVNPDPMVPGTWTLISGAGTITNPNSPTTTVTGLGMGVNTFRWTQDYGCQENFDFTQIIVYDGTPPPANAGADAELCSDNNTYVLQGNNPGNTAIGTWTVTAGGATIFNINNPNATATNLPIGQNILAWNLNNGPCPGGNTSDQVNIFVFDVNHPAANAGVDQEFCSDGFTSANLSGNLPIFPATGTWSVVSGTGTFANASARETTVIGLSTGENVFQWSIDNGPCGTLTDTVIITIYDASVANASAGADQELCTPATSTALSAIEPNGPGFGTWSLVSGSGTFSNANNASATVSNLAIGTNVLRWTVDNGPCAATGSFDDLVITVFDNNLAPANAGEDQQLCVATITELALNAVPVNGPASGTWSVVTGGGTVLSPNDPNSLVSGLSLGTNIFLWTVDNGPCAAPTNDQVVITLFNDDLAPANAGPDASFCTPTSTYTMQAWAPTAPAMGQWSLVSGTGTISNVNNPNANISGLGIGANLFRWSILNGPCPGAVEFDEMTIFIFDENAPVANAGPNQSICFNPVVPQSVTMAANSAIFPGTGEWTLVSGSGSIANPSSPTTTITNLAVGENVFQWSINNGPCAQGVSTDLVSVFVFDLGQAAANAGPNQDLCSDNPTTALAGNAVTFPATGTWVLISGSGSIANPNNPNSVVSGLGAGVNVFQYTVNNGTCGAITTDQVVITVYEGALSPANAGPDQVICSSTPSVILNGNNPQAPASGAWSLVSGSGNITNPTAFNTSVTGLGVGVNVFEWAVDNGACSGFTNDQVSITVFDSTAPAANAGPDEQLCLPQTSTVLAATQATFPAIGTWTVVAGTGIFANATNPTTTVSGLSVGVNTFRWTVPNGPCAPASTNDLVSITVFSNAQTINAGPDQDLCTPVISTTMNGTAPILPATGQWTLVSGSGNIVNPSNPTTAINGLGLGENVFQWSISNGTCAGSPLTDQVVVTVFNNDQADANAGADIELCTPQSSVALSANAAVSPATGLWTLISGSATIDAPANPNTTVSGLGVGTVVLQWTIDNGPCSPPTSTDQVTIRIYDTNAPAANAGGDLQFCQPAGVVAFSGNSPVAPAIGQWTLLSGTGIIANPSNPTTTVSGLGVGNNVFQWTITNGVCGGTTNDQVTLSVFSPTAPVAQAGEDQNLCTPENFTVLAGNTPQIPGTGMWTLVSGSGDIVNPNSPSSPIENLAIGETVFQWTINNGPCGNTTNQVSIFVFDGGAPQANAGLDFSLCTPDNSVQLNASPAVDPGVGTWTLVSGTGSIANVNDPNTTLSNLGVGVNTFAWTLDYATCGTQADLMNVVVFDSSIPPANAGSNQELCTPTDFTTLNASGVSAPAIGTWTLIQGNGDILNPNSPNSAVQNLGLGENIFVWTLFNGNCLDVADRTDTVSIFLFNADLADAFAGNDQEFCTPNTSATLTATPLNGAATGQWTLVSGGGNIVNPTSATTAVSNLPVGQNIFEWTVDNGPCANGVTSDQVSIFIFDENQTAANAGDDQQWCTPLNSVQLNGNAVTFPAQGTWTLISGSGTIVNPNNPSTFVANLAPGENIFRWRIVNGPCGSFTQDFVSIFVFNAFNEVATAGADQELCSPNLSTLLEGNTPQLPANGAWTLVSGSGSIANPNNPNSAVSNLAIGVNVFQWTVNNGPCANGVTSDTVTIAVFDPNAATADAGENQTFCTPIVSTALEGNAPAFPGLGTWTLVSGSGNIVDPNDPSTEVTNLGIGDNVFEWTIYNGPCLGSGSSDFVTITVFDRLQSAADAGNDQALCTPQEATVLTANAAEYPATGFWTLIQGGGTIVDVNNPNSPFINVQPGVNVLMWTVDNGVCEPDVTTDLVTISLFEFDSQDADAGQDQEFCLPITETVLNANATTAAAVGTWSVSSGTANFADANDPNTTVTGLSVGENVLAWTINNGPCGLSSDQIVVRIFDPSAPEASAGDDQFFCTPTSTTVLNGNTPAIPGIGTWTLEGGMGTIANPNDPTTLLSGLTIGENVFCWTIYNGPCEEPTTDCVSIFIYDENQPNATAGLDQELCLPISTTLLQATPAIFPAFGTWELVSGSGTIADPSNPNSSVSGLELGENVFQWTINNAPCTAGNSSDLVTIYVFEEGIDPAFAGNDQAFCAPTSTTTLTASPLNSPNTGTWELLDGNGTIDSPFTETTTVSGLTVGENVFIWTVYNGSCELALSTDTLSVFIFDNLQEPANAGEDQELCLPVNGTFLQANNAVFPAVGQWVVIDGSGTVINPNDPNSAVADLAVGINTFQWTITNGECEDSTTSDTVTMYVFSEDAAEADAGPNQSICTPEGSVVLAAAVPDVPSTGTWTVIQGGGSVSNPNDPNAILSALTVGEHILQWTIYNGPCTNNNSFDFVTITVFDGSQEPAAAGENQDLCAPDDTVVMNAEAPIFPATGTWSILSGSGSIANPNDPITTVSDLPIGVTVLRWTVNNGPCGEPSEALMTITVYNPDSPDAQAGTDQSFCAPFGGTQLEGNSPLQPATGQWTLISGSAVIGNPSVHNTTVTNLGLGTNAFMWTITNGVCANAITSDTVWVYVNDINVAQADAGLDQSLCGIPAELQLEGSETIGNTAAGLWTIIEGGADFENINNEATYISNLQLGTNTFVWTVDNGECGVSSDEVTITVYNPELPSAFAGTDLEICEDDFIIFNLPGSDVEFPATGEWTLLSGPIEISDLNDPNATVWSLGNISSPLVDVVSELIWTVNNGPCGTTADTASYTLLDCLTIDIPDAFSPNNDGINDFFEVPNLYKYPNNFIKIFNRWGVEVFQAAPYRNDWDGRSIHPATFGEELPSSTYYYILDIGEPNVPVFTGYIYLKR